MICLTEILVGIYNILRAVDGRQHTFVSLMDDSFNKNKL